MASLTNKIKNADRVLKANNLIVQSIENADNPNIMRQMLDVSQRISDIHKACVADLDPEDSSEGTEDTDGKTDVVTFG